METILSIFLGIGLSASVGFRVFLPLFALSLAAYFNVWDLNESWMWVGSTTAVITLGIATLVEIVAYYIPVIDNALDTIAIPLATLAGTAVMVSTVADLSPVITWALAIIAGGGTAAAVKSSASTTRLGSTVSTAGIANPIISTVETGTSIVMSVMSIFLPIVAILLVLLIFYLIYKFYKKIKRKAP
ncbi:DUF4126 domain-containing protein [Winogradskyella endarachnes]|uniref:DUF4126 family protein n=1 Tax=Winogradskyella endarachnes TaxID=2681965 RepID=A0A6L6U5B1_9FLAO|nr:DUF4126 domain-containing protein [Winogradskyella endarachnes]MUU77363.1 DUF4126 family protein [Winogradskyella endarachnes]